MKKVISLVVVCVVLAAGLTFASGTKENSTATKKYTIGVSLQGTNNAWAAASFAHFKYAFGVKYANQIGHVYYAECGYDPNKQISDIEDLITRNLDLLIVQPVSETATAGVIAKAKAAGIKVVIYGGLAGTDQYNAYVDRDNVKAGYDYASFVAKQIGGKGNVVVIMGYPGSGYSNNVLKGVHEALANYPNVKILGVEYADYTPAKSKQIMESYFAKGESIDGVIVDGGLMDLGVVNAFVDAKKPIPPTTADDWFGYLKRAVSLKYTNYVVLSSGEALALDAADVAMKILHGESVPRNELVAPTAWTGAQVEKTINLSLPDSYWLGSKIPKDLISKYYK